MEKKCGTLNKLEMRAMLASACGEGIMKWIMIKSGRQSIKHWFFVDTDVKKEEKK